MVNGLDTAIVIISCVLIRMKWVGGGGVEQSWGRVRVDVIEARPVWKYLRGNSCSNKFLNSFICVVFGLDSSKMIGR